MNMTGISVGFIFILFVMGAYALECPKAPEQVKKDWEVEVNAEVAKIGPLKGPALKTKTKKATEDLLGKLPDAGKIYLEQMMFSAYCSALRDDQTIKESEKAKLLKEYRKDVIPTVKAISKKSRKKQSTKSTTSIPQLQMPRFSEKTDNVEFSLGEHGVTIGYSVSELKKSSKEPYSFAKFSPVKVYIKNDILCADVKVFGGNGFPPIEIKENRLLNKPPSWDFNSNDKALEIVDGNNVPMYQFFYKTQSHIVVNGIFPFPGGLILASEDGVTLNPTLPIKFKLNRIFKYPSWKFPGVYE